MKTKLYKVIKNNESFSGGCFDWKDYLPKKGKKGKWTPKIINLELCGEGYHVTPYWNMWYEKGCVVYECECDGLVEEKQSVGVVDKFVCERLRLVKRLVLKFDKKQNTGDYNTGHYNTGDKNTGYSNTGNWNTGYKNTGNWNTGNWNTGYKNTGNSNTGDCNTGYKNTGYKNTGDCNTGYKNTGNSNTGHSNTGYKNTGNWNTGHSNTGYKNTGNSNTGNWNTGYKNTGNSNTGDWNSANLHVGCFNTKQPKYIELFNKPIKKELYDKIIFPTYFFFNHEGNYKKGWKKSFKQATKEEVIQTIKLPNFNYKIFEEITGITKKEIQEVTK